MLKNLVIFYLLLTTINPISHAQKPTIPDDVKESVKFRVDNGINTGIVIGIITPEVNYYSYGVKSLKSKEPVDKNSIFEIGSISKTFTGILLADMVIKGDLKLDDPLQSLLPDSVRAPTRNGESIRLFQLSNHTSGLPRMPSNFTPANNANPFVDYPENQLYNFLNNYTLTRDIGAEYEYSNYAAGLLGHLLAEKKHMTYEELMLKVIAEPLGMKNTRIALTPQMKKNLARGHSNGNEVPNWDFTSLAGAGGIRSNAVDMLKYLTANMGLKKSSLSPAMQLSHKNSRVEGANPEVGLGWHILKSEGKEIVWHNGGTGGYKTFTGFVNGGNKGVIIMTNSNVSVDDIGIHILAPEIPLNKSKIPVANKLRDIIDNKGIEIARNTYWVLMKQQADDYDLEEIQLNNLGYAYLASNEIEKATAVFKINTEAYPNSFNVYDSYGEALLKGGNKEKAIENYKKSVALNPGNENGIKALKDLGVNADNLVKEISIDDITLKSYIGKYELVPGFVITITKDGNQMSAQATGQPKFDIYPRTQNVFYLKIVEAQITFNLDNKGKVESLTLLQGGQETTGLRLKD